MNAPLRLAVQDARPKSRKRAPWAFSVPEALQIADLLLGGAPTGSTERSPGAGELVHRFVLPLELCKTTNALISLVGGSARRGAKERMSGSQRVASYKKKVFDKLFLQHARIRAQPLGGRPLLRCVRFSSVETDDAADGLKVAIDYLRVPTPPRWDATKNRFVGGKKGLGLLVDDKRKNVRRVDWWERVPPGRGFSLLEVWTG